MKKGAGLREEPDPAFAKRVAKEAKQREEALAKERKAAAEAAAAEAGGSGSDGEARRLPACPRRAARHRGALRMRCRRSAVSLRQPS